MKRHIKLGTIKTLSASLRYSLAILVACLLLPGLAQAQAKPTVIAFFGDSLAAGYGLPAAQALPARLEAALLAQGKAVKITNAGVSGDTSAGGRARLDWTLAEKPDLVIVELGANDALRGIDPAQTEANLDAIIARIKQGGAKVVLAGMLAPPNWGNEYGEAFKAIYPRLAAKHAVPLYPFLLDGVAADPALNQADGIHPNAQGVDMIVARLLPMMLKALE